MNGIRLCATGAVCAMSLYAGTAAAGGMFGDKLFGLFDYSSSGTIRLDLAYSTTNVDNLSEAFETGYNDQKRHRVPGNPKLPLSVVSGLGLGVLEDAINNAAPPFSVPLTVLADDFESRLHQKQNDWNYHVLRYIGELDVDLAPGWRFVARIRALYNLGGYDTAYNGGDYSYDGGAGQIINLEAPDNPALYEYEPNSFAFNVVGEKSPLWLSYGTEDYFIDFPAFLVEWTNGATTVRFGRQQIAWGKTLFFRIIDKASALDLRRHLILDNALEEFADERVPAVGFRVTHQITNNILVDSYAKRFVPRIYSNPNTTYAVIPGQFTLQDKYVEGDYDENVDFGIRVRGDYGSWGWQLAYFYRYNPAGWISWDESGVDQNLPNINQDGSTNTLGSVLNTYCTAVLGTTTGGCGSKLAHTPFAVAPEQAAVNFADQFAVGFSRVRVDAVDGLNNAVGDFPAAQQLLTSQVDNYADYRREANAFFIASGGLRGHIQRKFDRENVFGGGLTYVTHFGDVSSASFWNQIVLNVEMAYTPDKHYTSLGLNKDALVDDEFEFAFVAEKYYRVVPDWPSTFMVFQYLYRSTSDLFDRHKSGFGEYPSKQGVGVDEVGFVINNPGVSNFQYVALAFLQPSDLFIHSFVLAMLADVNGGILIQPGYKWKPNGTYTLEFFYNYIDADTPWGSPADSSLETIEFASEIAMRLTYAF